jgi:hypothetical protein
VFALYPTFREVTSQLLVQGTIQTILQHKMENSFVVRNNCSDARERLVPKVSRFAHDRTEMDLSWRGPLLEGLRGCRHSFLFPPSTGPLVAFLIFRFTRAILQPLVAPSISLESAR